MRINFEVTPLTLQMSDINEPRATVGRLHSALGAFDDITPEDGMKYLGLPEERFSKDATGGDFRTIGFSCFGRAVKQGINPLSSGNDFYKVEDQILVCYPGISIIELSELLELKYGKDNPFSFYYTSDEAWYKDNPAGESTKDAYWYWIDKNNLEGHCVGLLCYTLVVHALKTGNKLANDKKGITEGLVKCHEKDVYDKNVCVVYLDRGLYLTWDPRIKITTSK